MEKLLSSIQIRINDQLYLKDPDSTEIGKKIIGNSIDLIDELGFEDFTFKKLGHSIGSPESTIYRYFENKHTLLVYLTSWYWTWMEYRLVFDLSNIDSPVDRLKKAIATLTEPVYEDSNFSHVNEIKLNRIVISESQKGYFSKHVDEENAKGYFVVYKRLVQRMTDIILQIRPDFEFPHTLASVIIEGAHQQKFFAEHLPRLTDIKEDDKKIIQFFTDMALSMLKNGKK